MKLLYATLVEASRAWRDLPMTLKTLREMDRLRSGLFGEKKLAQTPDGCAYAAEYLQDKNGI